MLPLIVMIMNQSHDKLADEYFAFLAKRFPVMCASDEFHFLPRAEAAHFFYDRLDNFNKAGIEECLFQIKQFKTKFDQLAERETIDQDAAIDLSLLSANAASVEIEFEKNRTYCHNPLLYLKVIFIGLDHALNKPASEPEENKDRFFARLGAVPDLLKQARENIVSVPLSYYKAAFFMIQDGRAYLADTMRKLSDDPEDSIKPPQIQQFQTCLSSLEAFEKYLSSLSPTPDRRFGTGAINETGENYFMSVRSLADVFEIAVDEWHDTLTLLETIKSRIDPARSWQELYHSYTPKSIEHHDILNLYRMETDNLRLFFMDRDFKPNDLSMPMDVVETPSYLRSVRGTASFAAALRSDNREKSFFYITPRLPGENSKEEISLIRRFHREYKFLTAHETFPGHHLLDTVRRRLKNPVRRQIESPLFYEGWASYAESLLTEYGYADKPFDRLIDCKRRLWRSARCQIDAGLSTGRMDREAASRLLMAAGFSLKEAARQLDRFQLNPGYQICYTLGRYEIMNLKELYDKRIRDKKFHSFLLEGGELPFHLIEKKLAGMAPAG